MRFEAKLSSVTTAGNTRPTAAKIANAARIPALAAEQQRGEHPEEHRRRRNADQRSARRVQVAQADVREHDRRAEEGGGEQRQRSAGIHRSAGFKAPLPPGIASSSILLSGTCEVKSGKPYIATICAGFERAYDSAAATTRGRHVRIARMVGARDTARPRGIDARVCAGLERPESPPRSSTRRRSPRRPSRSTAAARPRNTKASRRNSSSVSPGSRCPSRAASATCSTRRSMPELEAKKLERPISRYSDTAGFPALEKGRRPALFQAGGFDRIDAAFKDEDGAFVGVAVHGHPYAYNPRLVRGEDIPRSALDFLKPQFRGRSSPVIRPTTMRRCICSTASSRNTAGNMK